MSLSLRIVLAVALVAYVPGSGAPALASPPVEQQARLNIADLPVVHITSLGRVLRDDTGVNGGVAGIRGNCPPEVKSHTDANFSGGTFVVQGGFAQTEMAGASYVVSATRFPYRMALAEMIFATSNSTVQTTTQWSVLFWDGTPDTGNLLGSFSSDDVILPHIVIPPGTNGVNVQFSIDPMDPEQVTFTNPSGNNTISFAYRIDHHNQQTQNPCFVAPPTCCNAFPTTDTSGLQQPANNWLFGVNCGPFGCPANGGWARFSQLPGFCRPSGDWVMRLSVEPSGCQPAVGACCIQGVCSINTQTACQQGGGTYQGDGTTCAGVNCPQPTGGCCFKSTGNCIQLTQANCDGAGGVYQGNGTQCGQIICFPMGACCLIDGSCIGPVSPEDCQQQFGDFQGDDTDCASANCPPPMGACCFSNGFCLTLIESECLAAGASWAGPLTSCDTPRFTLQPANEAGCQGGSVTFMSRACGNTVTYQWRFNGDNIVGATSANYTRNNLTGLDAGTYDVVATSFGTSTPSDPATLTVGLNCDANCDGEVNVLDINGFVLAVQNQQSWQAQFNCGYLCANDVNHDGFVNVLDVNAFVACLQGN
ncbi:hypothetical protein RAS1_27490 [Phycisphaerae bacterium RAS1]|nr:hypothetical protein RAS1_27490 [Phycisphaerae bacterium RAS1]